MDRLNLIIGLALAAISAILLIFPKLRETYFLKCLFVSFIAIGCLVSLFNSNWYLHKKHYDDKNIHVQLKQLPHVIKTDTSQIYSYVLIIENKYSPKIKIKKIDVNINSKMPILDYKVLLNDSNKDSIKIEIKDISNVMLSAPELKGEGIICVSFWCNPMLGSMPKNMTLALEHIPVRFEYELFNVPHEVPPKRGIQGVQLSNKQYNQKAILFQETIALDHRQVFDEDIEYQYGQYSIGNGSRHVRIFCSRDKFINIKYKGLQGAIHYKSKGKLCPDCRKVDVIRMIAFRNDFFLLEGTFEFLRNTP